MMASLNPRRSITSASSVYMMPTLLWSTVVSHSCQSHFHRPMQVMSPSTQAIPTRITEHVTMMIGWSNGIAASVSFPNIFNSLHS
jgi:hypothetical protein